MRNGTYKYKHNHLNNEVYVSVYNKKLSLYRMDSVNGKLITLDYIGRIDEVKLKADYTLIEEIKRDSTWSLKYYNSKGQCLETIMKNAYFGVCFSKKSELTRTTHKTGTLKIERYDSRTIAARHNG